MVYLYLGLPVPKTISLIDILNYQELMNHLRQTFVGFQIDAKWCLVLDSS